MIRAFFVFLTGLFPLAVQAAPLAVGAPAPQVSAIDEAGKPIQFADVYAKGTTLVYFYPKADTPGCTAEACSLRDSYTGLHGKGLQIIGVSRDNADAQKKFQDKYKLPFTLVADADGKVAEAFGVPMMMGGLIPVASRQSFIVKNGKIAWTSLKAQTKGSAAEVQKALDGLK
jgi:thioredoxin-dependent peroxiredoxin